MEKSVVKPVDASEPMPKKAAPAPANPVAAVTQQVAKLNIAAAPFQSSQFNIAAAPFQSRQFAPAPAQVTAPIIASQPAEAAPVAEVATVAAGPVELIPGGPEITHVSRTEVPADGKAPAVQGAVMTLDTNFYQLKLDGKKSVYQYDIDVQPPLPQKLKLRALMNEVLSTPAFSKLACAFDGSKILFTSAVIPGVPLSLVVTLTDQAVDRVMGIEALAPPPAKGVKAAACSPAAAAPGGREFTVRVTPTQSNEVSLAPLAAYFGGAAANPDTVVPRLQLQALDIAFKEFFTDPRHFFTFNHSFFSKTDPNSEVPLGPGVVCWLGHFAAVHPTQGGLSLMLDTAAVAMWDSNMSLMAYLQELLRKQTFGPADRAALDRAMKKVKIEVTHRPTAQQFMIKGLAALPANKDMVEIEDESGAKKTMSVVEYFQLKYPKVKLQFPMLPCVEVGQSKMKFPIEVCRLARCCRYDRELTPDMRAAMIDVTRLSPNERKGRVSLAPLMATINNDKLLKGFGITVSTPDRSMQAPARLLPTPQIQYGGNVTVQIESGKGDWGRESGRSRYVDPAQNRAIRVSLFTFAQDIPVADAHAFFKEQINVCRQRGLNLALIADKTTAIPLDNRALAVFEAAVKTDKPELALCILPTGTCPFYEVLKKETETRIGVITNCYNGIKVRRANPTYYFNCAAKINAKLGGTCHVLKESISDLLKQSTMCVGCDVYHPPPMSSDPSIAAVVGSYDNNLSKYATEISFQTGRVEQILGMETCIVNLLQTYQKHNANALPQRILVTRDGVSEGFFDIVLTHEINAIRTAAKRVKLDYNPKITFLSVQKRHHAVFFPRGRDGDRNGNAKAGTCVDSVVVDPRDADFYLFGHAAIIGTSRPMHNHVLLNEGKYTMPEMEQLMFYLSHLYQRCSKSVSIPAPAYYAHLAAYRARFYLPRGAFSDTESQSSRGSGGRKVATIIPSPAVVALMKTKLYFC